MKRLTIHTVTSVLFAHLKIRRLHLCLDGEIVGDIWHHRELNDRIAEVAADHRLSLLNEGFPLLQAELDKGLCLDMAAVAAIIQAAPAHWIKKKGYGLKLSFDDSNQETLCTFDGPALEGWIIKCFLHALILIDGKIEDGELDLWVGLALLQAVADTELPLEPPEEKKVDDVFEASVYLNGVLREDSSLRN